MEEGLAGLAAPALAAGLVVAATHVPLGREVLRRGIVFLDLAVAQVAGLGAVAAGMLPGGQGAWGQAAAFFCALAAALAFARLEKKGPAVQEALIGCAFVLAASVVVLLLAGDPHGGEAAGNLLAGQILWVRWEEVGLAAVVSVPVLALLLFQPVAARRFFYPLFAACVTLSVQLVGVYLVFASLILPALATRGVEGRAGVALGWLVSCVAVAGGLAVSVAADLPSGPMLVFAYAVAAGACSLCRLSRGKS
jgi:zinc/manganese transport system permease protein